MDNSTIDTVFSILRADVKPLREPIVSKVARTSDALGTLTGPSLTPGLVGVATSGASIACPS